MARYVPTPFEIEWTKRLIDGLRHGAFWASPKRKTVYRLDKINKTFWLVSGENEDLFDQLTAACEPLGYKVRKIGDEEDSFST